MLQEYSMFFTTQLQETRPNLISWRKGSVRFQASTLLPMATSAELWVHILVRFKPQTPLNQHKLKLFAVTQFLHHTILPFPTVTRKNNSQWLRVRLW